MIARESAETDHVVAGGVDLASVDALILGVAPAEAVLMAVLDDTP
jgi:hypothetical protein